MHRLLLALFAIVAAAGFVLVVASFLPLYPTHVWWVRILDFPRLQIAIALVGLGLLAVPFVPRFRRATALLGLAMATALSYQLWVLLPYLPTGAAFARQACPVEDRLSVMVANVRLTNAPGEALLERIAEHDPDVFLALEVDRRWVEALSPLERRMPHTVIHPTGSYFGIALYSRRPLHDPQVRHLAGQDTPQIVTGLELASGEVIDFLGIHPRPPHPSQSALGRDAVLMQAGLILRDSERPGLIAGDLNATPWERAVADMQRVARLIDPRQGYGYIPTYDARSRWMAWPLDHVLHEAGFLPTRLERGAAFGSDHWPYLARLCRVRGAESHAPPPPEPALLDYARELIERARTGDASATGG